jgi:phosphoglycerate dehydrogenase-like enzyme
MPVEQYADEIRTRLPNWDVEVAHSRQEELDHIPDATIVTDRAIEPALIERAEEARLFACLSAGYDHLPLDELAEQNIAVTNASGVHGPNVAEQVLCNVLLFARRMHEGMRRQRNNEWRHYQAGELVGSTVMIVGLGTIGTAIADRLEVFDVETVGVRYSPEKGGPTDHVVGMESEKFEQWLGTTDFLLLACPLTETTRHLIGERELTTLPNHAVLVNVARGAVVDTNALVSVLKKAGGIDGAALDVTDPEPLPETNPLWDLENVVITPHMAGSTPKYYERRAAILAKNIGEIERTGRYTDLTNQVLVPDG